MSSNQIMTQNGMSRRAFVAGSMATAAASTVLPGCKFVAGFGSNTIPEPPNSTPCWSSGS